MSNADRLVRFGRSRGAALGGRPLPAREAERIPATEMFHLWSTLGRELDARDVGVAFARASRLEDLGLLGFVVLTAPTARVGLETFIKYSALLNDGVRWEASTAGRSVEVRRFGPTERTFGMRLSHETALAQLVGSIRQLCGRTVTPSYVGFQHSAPKVKEPHRSFFGCEIDFDAPFDRVVLARDPFELEPRGANAAIWSWLSTQADAELAKLAPRPLAQRVREEIGRALTLEAVASMTSVAATLGVSERTLRRALAAGGVTFRTLTDEARRDIAKTMLGREGTTITRVALEAGFADPSAFTHACRRWFGRSPSEIAQDAQRGRDD